VSAPELTVVICSLNGAAGVERCLSRLARQTVASCLQIVVVDDGSTDDTAAVATRHGVEVVRHRTNRGLAAARNSGVGAATAPIVAFLDDDCEPEPTWAERLVAAYRDDVIGVGGVVVPSAGRGFMDAFLTRHNPLAPLELELERSAALTYRLRLYVRRQWRAGSHAGRRVVYSLVGANMSFRRRALVDVGLFDARFTFGGEEFELCRRLARRHPDRPLLLEPDARVVHRFAPSLKDALRRSRAYGRGNARVYRTSPDTRPTFFPFPLLEAGALCLAARRPALLVPAAALPHAMFPRAMRDAFADRRFDALLDPYVQLAQEAAGNVGFVEGLWRFRALAETVP
jgi:GT2 family glycosyltransferase